ncbi:hypothetical protein [Mucilaginibacter myungsuensis]|uniref:Uncharacterized protein n=1 Tax=Mucilaginibacter myungsuensis TaxID=649104 RepID=A0A929PV28_9SPHI|nr:hypothetical protein [Mucilaginibacter myungsuensis]MBE9660561.1 hypothetical protein [Mucilaginibacter myungsuensis]MDN3600606.1 hypothetical protein [Mucilaginibacter myungsuensis]
MTINFIESAEDLAKAKEELSSIIKLDVDLIYNPFQKDFTIFKAFEFDRIYGLNFYKGLTDFLIKNRINEFTFYTLLPNPEDYFHHHFAKYSIVKVNANLSHDDFWDFLDTDPGNSPADALIFNAETVALYSKESSWGIVGSKDLEIGIIGFREEKVQKEFIRCFDPNVFVSIRSRLSDLDDMLNLSIDTKNIHELIIKSYTD